MRFATPLFAALLAAYAATATAQTPITLDQAMANPDWIGTPVDAAWWGWDSHQVYYSQKRLGAALHDTYTIAGGPAKLVGDAQLANADAANMVYNRDHTRAIVLRNGDLFERDLKNGALVQIVRGSTATADPQYAADGAHVQFRVGNDWYSWSRAERLVSPVALLRTAKDPDAAPEADSLRDIQLRLMSTLARVKGERDAKREQSNEQRRADARVSGREDLPEGQRAVAGRPLPAGRHDRQGGRQGQKGQDGQVRHRVRLRGGGRPARARRPRRSGGADAQAGRPERPLGARAVV